MYCHAYTFDERTNEGALCTLLKDHRSTNHLDVPHNKSWPVSPNDERTA